MSIEKTKAYMCSCDICKSYFLIDSDVEVLINSDNLLDKVKEHGWKMTGGFLVCQKCSKKKLFYNNIKIVDVKISDYFDRRVKKSVYGFVFRQDGKKHYKGYCRSPLFSSKELAKAKLVEIKKNLGNVRVVQVNSRGEFICNYIDK